MRRVIRWVWRVVVFVSLALGAGVGVLWVLSYQDLDPWAAVGKRSILHVEIREGGFGVTLDYWPGRLQTERARSVDLPGIHFFENVIIHLPGEGYRRQFIGYGRFWSLAGVFSVLPTAALVLVVVKRRRRLRRGGAGRGFEVLNREDASE
jgi:hypothetical protein